MYRHSFKTAYDVTKYHHQVKIIFSFFFATQTIKKPVTIEKEVPAWKEEKVADWKKITKPIWTEHQVPYWKEIQVPYWTEVSKILWLINAAGNVHGFL